MKKIVKKSLILKKIMLKFISIRASRIFIRKNEGGFCQEIVSAEFYRKKINRFGFLI
jgi:hypothetical protein